MALSVKYESFYANASLLKTLKDAKRKLQRESIEMEQLGGGKFRSKLVEILASDSKHENFLLFDENTALIVQVSSPGGAFSKFLDILLAKNRGEIQGCIFVTQTYEMAVRRNRIKNPDEEKDGHRIYFSLAVEKIRNYSESFLDIPIGILGVDY